MQLSSTSRWIAFGAVAYAVAGVSIFGAQSGVLKGKNYVGGRFALILEQKGVGQVSAIEGGDATATVVNFASGGTKFDNKHLGQVTYQPMSMRFGAGMDPALYNWVSSMMLGLAERKSGAVSTLNFEMKEASRLEFFNALLTEITFPACDASAKDVAHFELTFQPEYTRFLKGSGQAPGALNATPPPGKVRSISGGLRPGPRGVSTVPPSVAPQGVGSTTGAGREAKPWMPRFFRLTIDGVDCTRVTKIESFTVKQLIQPGGTGTDRFVFREATKLEFPNLEISVPEIALDTWRQWHEDFLVKGNNDDSKEKNGLIEFLDPSMTRAIFSIKLFNLGITKLGPVKAQSDADQIRRYVAELYCERMEFIVGR